MLFSGGACSRRVSLFLKPFSFPRRCAKLERERERVGSWERAGEFCRRCFVLCGMPREGGKRGKKKICLILKVARQTKQTRGAWSRSTTKKKEEKRQKARALHEVFMLCFVLFKTIVCAFEVFTFLTVIVDLFQKMSTQ